GGRLWILFGLACLGCGLYLATGPSHSWGGDGRHRWGLPSAVLPAFASVPTAVMMLNAQLAGIVALGIGAAIPLRSRPSLAGLAPARRLRGFGGRARRRRRSRRAARAAGRPGAGRGGAGGMGARAVVRLAGPLPRRVGLRDDGGASPGHRRRSRGRLGLPTRERRYFAVASTGTGVDAMMPSIRP